MQPRPPGAVTAAERLIRILALLANDAGGARRLCEVAAEVTSLTGAGVMLLADGRPQAALCSTDTVSTLIEEAQYSLGEGPGVDAHRTGAAIAEPDLADPAVARWPAFSPQALAGGARAVFGYPIRIGTVRLGALDLYRDRPGPLDADRHADALVVADVAARAILAAQAEAGQGDLGTGLDGTDHWPVVHQAAGMLAEQLDVPVADALVRLRAQAFRTELLITDVAREVVEGRLRLDR